MCLSARGAAQSSPTLAATPLPRRLWEEARAAHQGQGPALWVEYPRDGAAYGSGAVRFAGCTVAGAYVTVNGVAVRVYPTGAFAGVIRLEPGLNRLVFRSTVDGRSTTRTLSVGRGALPPKPLPSAPLASGSSAFAAQPPGQLELLPGETMPVRCQASPGGRACFQIGKRPTRYPMRELSTETAPSGLAGIYEGVYTVLPGDFFVRAPILITMDVFSDGRLNGTVKITPFGTLTVGDRRIVRVVEAMENDTGLYSDPSRRERILSAAQGTRLVVTGRQEDLLRVRLGAGQTAWAPEEKFRPVSRERKLPAARLRSVTVADEKPARAARLSLSIAHDRGESRPLPFRVDVADEETTLSLTVYGLRGRPFRVPFEPGDRPPRATWERVLDRGIAASDFVRQLRCEPADPESLSFLLTLANPIWGFDANYGDGGSVLDLRVRSRPLAPGSAAGPLSGSRIVLDPGHGGYDPGAIGPSGLCESDANLAIARRVGALLRAADATVLFTRQGDEYVALETRAEQIASSNADLFLSVHCNSVAEDDDPLQSQGAKIFYFYPQGERLAARMRTALAETIDSDVPLLGAARGDFRVIRVCSRMPGALIECLFLSHPGDEMRLLDPAFLDRMSTGIYKGLLGFLREPGSDAGPRSWESAGARERTPLGAPSLRNPSQEWSLAASGALALPPRR